MSIKSKILIIDANPDFSQTIMQDLEENYQLKSLQDATKAIKVCEDFKPNIILLELELVGNVDGLLLLRKIKSNQKLKQIPIFIMSTFSSKEIFIDALRLGATDYFVKPHQIDIMILKLKNILKLIAINRQDVVLVEHFNFDIEDSSANKVLANFEKMIDEVITKGLSVVKIAKRLDISQSTLTRLVKEKHGFTTNNYIMKRKLEKANILLMSDKGLNIKQICSALHFKSFSYFTKCYKHYYGKMPSKEKGTKTM